MYSRFKIGRAVGVAVVVCLPWVARVQDSQGDALLAVQSLRTATNPAIPFDKMCNAWDRFMSLPRKVVVESLRRFILGCVEGDIKYAEGWERLGPLITVIRNWIITNVKNNQDFKKADWLIQMLEELSVSKKLPPFVTMLFWFIIWENKAVREGLRINDRLRRILQKRIGITKRAHLLGLLLVGQHLRYARQQLLQIVEKCYDNDPETTLVAMRRLLRLGIGAPLPRLVELAKEGPYRNFYAYLLRRAIERFGGVPEEWGIPSVKFESVLTLLTQNRVSISPVTINFCPRLSKEGAAQIAQQCVKFYRYTARLLHLKEIPKLPHIFILPGPASLTALTDDTFKVGYFIPDLNVALVTLPEPLPSNPPLRNCPSRLLATCLHECAHAVLEKSAEVKTKNLLLECVVDGMVIAFRIKSGLPDYRLHLVKEAEPFLRSDVLFSLVEGFNSVRLAGAEKERARLLGACYIAFLICTKQDALPEIVRVLKQGKGLPKKVVSSRNWADFLLWLHSVK